MGHTSSVPCALSQEDIKSLVVSTSFSREDVKALWWHFHAMTNGAMNMDRTCFQASLRITDTYLMDRLFTLFDADSDDLVSFNEFLELVTVINTKSSREDKLKLSFKIYDLDEDGKISYKELKTMVWSTVREHGLELQEEDIDKILEATFKVRLAVTPPFSRSSALYTWSSTLFISQCDHLM
jgi:Ca2+-binding EF-hand superfamily protein